MKYASFFVSLYDCGPCRHIGVVPLSSPTGHKIILLLGSLENLENREIVDLVAIGAEFVCLASDGTAHEWNSYEPFEKRLTGVALEVIVSCYSNHLMILEPIAW